MSVMDASLEHKYSRLLREHPRYAYVATLGQGAFGVVQRVRQRQAPYKEYAVKFIKRGPKTVTKYVLSEILNQRELYHPHVIQHKETFLLREYLCIVMELASGGNLARYLAREGRLSEGRARSYFQQLILTTEYLHSKGISNRDIKPENICLMGNFREVIKICDFGYSKSDAKSKPKSKVGTPFYMAPEVIRAHTGRRYDGKAADVWSVGVTLYHMISGHLPFRPSARRGPGRLIDLYRKILDGRWEMPKGVSAELKDLLTGMLEVDPNRRMKIEDIKHHPWFLKNLPVGALGMTEKYLSREPHRRQAEEEIKRYVKKAMKEVRRNNLVAGLPVGR